MYLCKQIFHVSPVRISQKAKGAMMRSLRHIIFYVKTKILTDFHICISVPLTDKYLLNYAMNSFDKKMLLQGKIQLHTKTVGKITYID